MSTATYTSVFTEIKAMGEEEMPCEDPDHERLGDEGPGLWYIEAECPKCSNETGVLLVCENFKHDIDVDRLCICPKCDYKTGMKKVFRILGKRN